MFLHEVTANEEDLPPGDKRHHQREWMREYIGHNLEVLYTKLEILLNKNEHDVFTFEIDEEDYENGNEVEFIDRYLTRHRKLDLLNDLKNDQFTEMSILTSLEGYVLVYCRKTRQDLCSTLRKIVQRLNDLYERLPL